MFKISRTPFGTVHVGAVVPVADIPKTRRAFGALARREGFGKRLTVREHVFGQYARLGVVYRSR